MPCISVGAGYSAIRIHAPKSKLRHRKAYQVAPDILMDNLERGAASSVALRDRLPAAERPERLPKQARSYYDFIMEALPLRTSGPCA